ncbi:hypothetical protein MASR1M68_04840 [Elusimicrobiota bacterium]
MIISCVIPAFNEETTIVSLIRNIKKVESINEIIVVDDGSNDQTYNFAKSENITVLRHSKNKGKGASIKTGAGYASGDIILFLDADLANMSPKKIASLLQPLENDDADLVKASFSRARGRVTELVVKPLFQVILPFINFNQPLSGQFAIKSHIMKELTVDDKWGVDIQILIQAVKKGLRIVEVDIGKLIHKKQPIENLAIMSEQVIKSILAEIGMIANKHKLIIFDFDKTLIEESSIEVFASQFGFTKTLNDLRHQYQEHKIRDSQITTKLAEFFKGKTDDDLKIVYNKLHLQDNIIKVLERLKKRRYELAIVSHAFSPVVYNFAEILGIPKTNVICPVLVKGKNNKYNGEVLAKTHHNATCCDGIICKADAANELMEKLEVKPEECIAVGDGRSDECLFRASGLALAYKSNQKMGDISISHLSEILIYAE